MKRKHLIMALFGSFYSIACFGQDQPVNYGNNPPAGSYYNNNGTKISMKFMEKVNLSLVIVALEILHLIHTYSLKFTYNFHLLKAVIN